MLSSRTRAPRPSAARRAALLLVTALGPGCGEADVDDDGAPGNAPAPSCPPGAILGPSGECMPVGIQGCAPMFLGEDNLCHPRMDRCPPGTLPKFDEGCVPVGIPKCAPVFVGADGLCRPSMALCADAPGTFAVPQRGCVPIDGPDGCGAGTWGNISDAPGNVYVDRQAAPGGDGSKARPFDTIAGAMAAVGEGGRIALAAGTYDEGVAIVTPLELVGRCPSMVRIQGLAPDAGIPVVVLVEHVQATIRGVEIGGPGFGVMAAYGADVALVGVHIRGARHTGAMASAGAPRLAISRSLIEGSREIAGSDISGAGAAVLKGGKLVAESSAFIDNGAFGLVAEGELEATGNLIEGNAPLGRDGRSAGVLAVRGGRAALAGNAIVKNRPLGVIAAVAGSELTSTGDLIADTLTDATGKIGSGCVAAQGAKVAIDSSAVSAAHNLGLNTHDPGSTMAVVASLIEGTLPAVTGVGFGIQVTGGGHLSLDASAVVGNTGVGILTQDPGSLIATTSSLVEGTITAAMDLSAGSASTGGGDGVRTQLGGEVRFDGSAAVENHGVGVDLSIGPEGAPTSAVVTRSLIEGTLPSNEAGVGLGLGGFALSAVDATDLARRSLWKVSLDASAVLGNQAAAVILMGVDATVTRSLIASTAASPVLGQGVAVNCDVCALGISDSVVRDNQTTGLLLFAAQADVTRVLIDGVAAGRLIQTNPDAIIDGVGDGILALLGSSVNVSDSRVLHASRAGLLFDDSTGVIARTATTGNRFGVVLQGARRPELGDGNVFQSNSESDTVLGENLAVPDKPPPLP